MYVSKCVCCDFCVLAMFLLQKYIKEGKRRKWERSKKGTTEIETKKVCKYLNDGKRNLHVTFNIIGNFFFLFFFYFCFSSLLFFTSIR